MRTPSKLAISAFLFVKLLIPMQRFSLLSLILQLHTVLTVSPLASVCLNVDADHLDWHGSAQAYAADKAKVYHLTQKPVSIPA